MMSLAEQRREGGGEKRKRKEKKPIWIYTFHASDLALKCNAKRSIALVSGLSKPSIKLN